MAEIVAAAAAVHAPQLLSRPPHEELSKLDGSTDALRRLGEVLDETEPDAVLMIGLDHLETFWLEAVPTFTMIVSEQATARYMEREREVPIHTELATKLLHGVVGRGVDLTYSQQAVLGHAFLTPFEYVLADRQIPIVPMLVNTYLPPLPSPRRCHQLGQAIAAVLAERPERIAVIASGGMSHFPGTSRYHDPQYSFDEWILREVADGRYDRLLDLSPVQLDEVGEHELLTWFVALGIIGDQPGTLLSYQDLSHHGHGVVQFLPALSPSEGQRKDVPLYGGYEFTSDDYIYYRFPEPATLPLNRFLHELIADAEFRRKFVLDPQTTLAESSLTEEQRQVLAGDGFDALRDIGAHPLLALSARQVSDIEARKQGVKA